uniref:Secreted protein n=1 Tax=Meloidogyne floridensis TaxID=298350 RepID=A0A915NX45_9BILA
MFVLALCAKFVPFECVGLCEWVEADGGEGGGGGGGGGGCTLSSHYSAFRGLRTYMSGFVLNDQS